MTDAAAIDWPRDIFTAFKRLNIEQLAESVYAMRAHYGFKESPDVPELLESCKRH